MAVSAELVFYTDGDIARQTTFGAHVIGHVVSSEDGRKMLQVRKGRCIGSSVHASEWIDTGVDLASSWDYPVLNKARILELWEKFNGKVKAD